MTRIIMIILGIDPGIADTGFGVIEKIADKFRAIEFGTIQTKRQDKMPLRLNSLYTELSKIIKKHNPGKIAVEELFFAKNIKTGIVVSQARGVVMLASYQAGCKIEEYTPLQVKQALTGYGKADKHQMQAMVKTILGLEEIPKPDDAADALAVAICSAQTNSILSLRGSVPATVAI